MFFSVRSLTPILPMLLISSCMVGPNYQAPEMEAPGSWTVQDPALIPDPATTVQWWSVFNDPVLEDLIAQAARDNLDQKIALARLDAYRAMLAVAAGAKLPEANLGASTVRQGSSDNGVFNTGAYNQFQINAGLSWEMDLFGRVKRSIQAAEADYQAQEEMVRDVLTSLYAEVAAVYFQHRTLQARTTILQNNLKAQEQVLQLTRARARHGIGTDLEVAQSERLYAASEAQLPILRAAEKETLNQLALLLGKTPGQMKDLDKAPLPSPPGTVTAGVPVDLLRQRPDIRRAERLLAAQTARLGLAHAQLYPSLSISALIGLDALNGGDLLDAKSGVWSLGASLGQSLFNGGRLRNQIKVEDARTREALLEYEKTVLQALSEVETAMVRHVEQFRVVASFEEAMDAARRSTASANTLYKEGLADFQNVLDAQQQQLELEDRLTLARGDHATGLVNLYRALGGGWDPNTAGTLRP